MRTATHAGMRTSTRISMRTGMHTNVRTSVRAVKETLSLTPFALHHVKPFLHIIDFCARMWFFMALALLYLDRATQKGDTDEQAHHRLLEVRRPLLRVPHDDHEPLRLTEEASP